MRKFLSKTTSWLSSLLLVMLFAVGQSAWAQDATFNFSGGTNLQLRTVYSGDIYVDYYPYNGPANTYNNTCPMTVRCATKKIVKIEMIGRQMYNGDYTIKSGGGTLDTSNSDDTVWTGESNSVTFVGSGDCYISTCKVWLENDVPENPQEDYFAWKSLVKEDMKAVYDEYNGVKPTSSEVGQKPWDVVSAVMDYYESNNWIFGTPNGFGDDWESAKDYYERFNSSVSKEYKKALNIWNSYNEASVISIFGLASSQQTSWTSEYIDQYPTITLAENYETVRGNKDGVVTELQDVMTFKKDGVVIESPVGKIKLWPYSGNSSIYLNYENRVSEPGVYEFTFPAGIIVSQTGNINEEFTLTYTVVKQLNYQYSEKVGDKFTIGAIKMHFNHDVTAVNMDGIVLKNASDDILPTNYTIDGDVVTFTFEPVVTGETGFYLYIPTGNIDSDGVKNTSEISSSEYWLKAILAVSNEGWTTFCSTSNVKLPEGYTAYVVTGVEGDNVLNVEEVIGNPKALSDTYYFNYSGCVSKDGNVMTSLYGEEHPTTITSTNATFYDGSYLSMNNGGSLYIESSKNIKYIYLYGYNGFYYDWSVNGGTATNTNTINVNAKNVTISSDYAFILYISVYYEDDTQHEDVVIPANTGVLIKGDANQRVAYETTYDTPTTINNNLLVGCIADATWSDAGKTYYKFSLDFDNTAGSAGFYWGVEGGASIEAHAGKAYLVLPNNSNVRGFRLDGKTEATEGIFNALNGEEEAGAVYNLNGQRVNGKPAAGVYVKNGRKFIVK